MNFYDPKLQELYEAGLQLRPFLETSNGPEPFANFEEGAAWIKQRNSETEAQRLRRQAERLEAKDAAVTRFRNALNAMEEES